ncbi:hypothetical protein MS3_00001791 [Schistosoma haematobium]|uniref:Fasciclin-1 n=1 Tax=Schistosoma haematobium TaxID=6185 RepID=A0A095C6U5_SCHHA|nr:hypothetical protein MS3_00001791 [Schistosoma haematobium]KAH9595924.1 hypothetical protein MS3_00001791 [Schistosoma haematobium]CAH8475119.1 unnamed protein product [Schistosoma haematobium]CAH8476830.1 unnamed protein product [Schistosoma haematobium]
MKTSTDFMDKMLINYFSLIYFIYLSLLLIETQSINDNNLWQVITSYPNATKFADFIQEMRLQNLLEKPGCFGDDECLTIILPTNDAIDHMANDLAWYSLDDYQKHSFIHGHIIQRGITTGQSSVRVTTREWTKLGQQMNFVDIGFGTGVEYTTLLANQQFGFSTIADSTSLYFVNNAKIVTPDVMASNGIIQIVNQVLYTPYISSPFMEFLQKQGNLGISKELWYLLLQEPKYAPYPAQHIYSTIFVVNDSGWSSLPIIQLNRLRKNITLLASVLSYHYCPNQLIYREWISVKPNMNIYTGFPNRPQSATSIQLSELNPAQLYKSSGDSTIISSGNSEAKLEDKSFIIQKAIVHIIQKPLAFIFETREEILNRINSNLLSSCQSDTICKNILTSSTDITIFSPNAQAMQNFNKLSTSEKAIYLKYLFLPMKLYQAEMTLNRRIPIEKLEDAIRFKIIDQSTFIEARLPNQGYVASRIINANQVATNGIIHTIDAIPGLPYETVQQYVARIPDFNLYYNTGFVQSMTIGEPYTFLVPTNQAMTSMNNDNEVGRKLLTDKLRKDFVFRRNTFPLDLIIQDLDIRKVYYVSTANYAFTREQLRLDISSKNSDEEGVFIYQGEKIQLLSLNGPYQFTNGFLYSIDKILYTKSDLNATMCTVSACA